MSGRNGVPAGLFAIDFIAANSSFSGAAEQAQQPAFACTGEIIARGISNRAIDGRTFILDDGREVHLAAIEVPPLSSAAGTEPQGAATRDALAGLLAGRRSRAPASRATKNGSLRTHRGVCV
jgi:hypothetical protein